MKATAICLLALAIAPAAEAQVSVSGSIQCDAIIPETDEKIGTADYSEWGLTNTYADVNLQSKTIDAGLRFEYLKHPMPGFREIDKDFAGWGVPHIYVRLKPMRDFDITAGSFYDQFGSGFIFRAYEERSLGIDNSINGLRVNFNRVRGLRLKALGGYQRTYWKADRDVIVAGGDAELDISEFIPKMKGSGTIWTLGLSYLAKHEDDEDIVLPDLAHRLALPKTVHAFDIRTSLNSGPYSIMAEAAMKSQDPAADNGYTYHRGSAVMLSASYARHGLTGLVQAKRSENMQDRSQRSRLGTAAMLNNMPAFAYQHTYTLAALYPYATQAATGEWAFQTEWSYTFKRHTALGGAYGTKLKLNASHIRALANEPLPPVGGTTMGTDGYKTKFFKAGGLYYQDINVQMEKRISKALRLNAMYMNQYYDKTTVEGHGGIVKSNIFVGEARWQMSRKATLRTELQYLSTKDDDGDWLFGLAELSLAPHIMLTASDEWNCGETDLHYYMFQATGTLKAHRLMIGYGRTRAGYNCSGGVCRWVPASRGLQLTYNYNF